LHSQGLLPLERLITYYSIHDYEKAIADVVGGLAIKAVILWNEKPIEL
jgi:Zn-dependent alcohol dehydrogenase